MDARGRVTADRSREVGLLHPTPPHSNRARRGRLVLIGLGLLGSHLVPHLARLGSLLKELVLIDDDIYDSSNLVGQDITPKDVGHRKVAVQWRRLEAIHPGLSVRAIGHRLEAVPWGRLRADALVSCLDSRRARQLVNEIAWRLGVPWIDAGVRAEQRLVRVSAYRPAAEAPCLECAWDGRDYDALEAVHACSKQDFRTGGSSSLGGVAAGLLALECEKLLGEGRVGPLFSSRVVLELEHHHHDRTHFTRNPQCRFDHERWTIEPLTIDRERSSLGDLFQTALEIVGKGPVAIRVAETGWTTELTCLRCGGGVSELGVVGRSSGRRSRCRHCDRDLLPNPAHTHAWLAPDDAPDLLDRSLRSLRVRTGDIVTIRGGADRTRHVELGPAMLPEPPPPKGSM